MLSPAPPMFENKNPSRRFILLTSSSANDKSVFLQRRSGGIGRHTILRGWRAIACTSSSLVFGTTQMQRSCLTAGAFLFLNFPATRFTVSALLPPVFHGTNNHSSRQHSSTSLSNEKHYVSFIQSCPPVLLLSQGKICKVVRLTTNQHPI